jgi:signal transduction histidine kinase
VEFYAPAAEIKNIRLQLHAQGSLQVSGDPVLLAQALSNLIDNALKYTPPDGVIEVTLQRRADGRAEIAVADNGPGIHDSEKSKVVERFYRGDASRGTPGVGLGLSLAQAVAKLHGSSLELADRAPGLKVVLSIALNEEPSAAVAEPRPATAPEPVLRIAKSV